MQFTSEQQKSFSDFTHKETCQQLGITELTRWTIEAEPTPISDFFRQRLARLQRFDRVQSEVGKLTLVDAICEEGLAATQRLKVWKGAYLEGEHTCGTVDYLIAERRAYLEDPFACVVQAQNDDFERGEAECLVVMQACQRVNRGSGKAIDAYGIVTNGEGWKFYRLATSGQASVSLMSGVGDMAGLLGQVSAFFKLCEQSLS